MGYHGNSLFVWVRNTYSYSHIPHPHDSPPRLHLKKKTESNYIVVQASIFRCFYFQECLKLVCNTCLHNASGRHRKHSTVALPAPSREMMTASQHACHHCKRIYLQLDLLIQSCTVWVLLSYIWYMCIICIIHCIYIYVLQLTPFFKGWPLTMAPLAFNLPKDDGFIFFLNI